MNKKEFIKELLIELSYRSDEGYPILTKKEHIHILSEILDEWGMGNIKNELIQNLFEAGETSDEDKKYKGIGGQPPAYVKSNDYQKWQSNPDGFNGPRFKKTDSGKYVQLGDGDTGDGDTQSAPNIFSPEYGYDAPDLKQNNSNKTDLEKEKKIEAPKKVVSGEPNQKDKRLEPDVNTTSTEVYTSAATGIDDESYTAQKEVELINPDLDYTNDINNIIEGSGIPLKYGKVLARLLNTKNKNQISITNVMSGVGAGQIASQAGEILTMVAIGLDDEQSNQLFGKVNEIIGSQSKKDYPIIDASWVESAKLVRDTTIKRYDNEFGAGVWKIDNVAWDVKNEFEALGNSNYEANKGFSSDMYVKVSVNGEPVLDEISLKKDSEAMLYNGAVTDVKEWFGGEVPPAADFDTYKTGELNRPVQYAENVSEDEYKSVFSKSNEDIKDSLVNSTGYIRQSLVNTGILQINKETNRMEVTPNGEAYIKDFRSLEVPPQIDRERFKDVFGSGAADRFKKGMIVHASILASEGNKNAYSFLNKHLGYEVGDDGKYAEGSIKRYQNDTIRALVESDRAKTALLGALQEKLPMKSLIEGEEKMAIGGLSVDSQTLKNLMNIDSFEDFKGGLEMEEDASGNNYLVYKSVGPPAKEVKLAEVKVRQKGQGYASSVGLEFVIAPDFAKQLYQSNVDIYGSVELSKKEKRRLKV